MWSHKDMVRVGKLFLKESILQDIAGYMNFGTNWRMTEMQAAIGRIQLNAKDWNTMRPPMLTLFGKANDLKGVRVPRLNCFGCAGECNDSKGCTHGAYKCYVFVEGSERDRNKILSGIKQKGVPCFPVLFRSLPEKALKDFFQAKKAMPNAKRLGETSLMFLCHPTLTKYEIQKLALHWLSCNGTLCK